MGLKAEVHFAGHIFKILVFYRRMHQAIDEVNKPIGRPTGHVIDLVLESSNETNEFAAWLVGQGMKELKIVFSPVTGNGKSRTVLLRDAYCVFFKEDFKSTTAYPMTSLVSISAGIVDDGGVKHFEYWKVSDIVPPKMVDPTPVPREIKPKITQYYFTDTNNNEVENTSIEETVFLHIHSKDLLGKTINIDLGNQSEIQFKHKGKILENNILSDYAVKSSHEKVKLEIVAKK